MILFSLRIRVTYYICLCIFVFFSTQHCQCSSYIPSKDGVENAVDGGVERISQDQDTPPEQSEERKNQVCEDGQKKTCFTGPQLRPPCKEGFKTCTQGVWGACNGQILPKPETCNGKDDNCDGKVDSPLPPREPCYTGPIKTENVGSCTKGYRECFRGTVTFCNNQKTPTKEVCDLSDNDCDGYVDEDNVCKNPPNTQKMTEIKEGEFILGVTSAQNPSAAPSELPGVKTFLSQFSIDSYEVTNLDYTKCVKSNTCTPVTLPKAAISYPKFPKDYLKSEKFNDFPIIGITWHQAKTYCKWKGKELPTEAQWERAAKGIQTVYALYPWGNNKAEDCSLANTSFFFSNGALFPCHHYPSRVGSYPKDQNKETFDIVGNVREWTKDCYSSSWYRTSQFFKNPENNQCNFGTQPRNALRTVRGGSFIRPLRDSRMTIRTENPGNLGAIDIGFRCVKNKK